MLTKRSAIIAVFSGVLAKLAHADDPNWKATAPSADSNYVLMNMNQPLTWTVNLDSMKQLDVIMNGTTVIITPAEIFAALAENRSKVQTDR